MYIFDTGVFVTLGHYYPKRFPTLWAKLDSLAITGELASVREVRQEIEKNFDIEHVLDWVGRNRSIFLTPTSEEMAVVSELMSKQVGRELVQKKNIIKGLPAADPFIIAAGKILNGTVVTQEELKPNAARIPWFCQQRQIDCINLEKFFEREGIQY